MAATATLRIRRLGGDVRRFEVDCPSATTGLTIIPSAHMDLADAHLILAVGWQHEELCGKCSVEGVLRQGDPALRAVVDRAFERGVPLRAAVGPERGN